MLSKHALMSALDGPLVREPALVFRSSLTGTQETSKMLQRSVNASAGSGSRTRSDRSPPRTPARGCSSALPAQPCPSRWGYRGRETSPVVRSSDQHASDRTRPVGARSKFRARIGDECIDPVDQDLPHREPVYAGRATTRFRVTRATAIRKLRSSVTRPHSLQNT